MDIEFVLPKKLCEIINDYAPFQLILDLKYSQWKLVIASNGEVVEFVCASNSLLELEKKLLKWIKENPDYKYR